MSPWIACCLLLFGHNPDTSYARITIGADKIQTRLTYDVFTLLKIVNLDDNGDAQLSREELARHAPRLYEFFRGRIGLAISEDDEQADVGQPAGFVWPPDVGETIPASEFHSALGLIHFDFVRPLERVPEEVAIAFGFFDELGERHTVLGVFVYGGQEYETSFTRYEPDFTYVTGAEPAQVADEAKTARPRPPPTAQTPLRHRLWRFFKMGVEHIFMGYDHICFLAALIVVSRFREIVKIVTSFTIAHSITLILAALNIVHVPTRLVEVCIAGTIVYVAVENLWVTDTSHRWWLTFFFGLVHGFGFANVLREMGLPTTGLVRCLISFNVGVEAGQLVIATALLPVALLLTRWEHGPKAIFAFSVLLAAFGAGWFVERALDLGFMPF